MTAMPEAKLAREAELPHATLALATDYDCWHESGETVSAGAVMEAMRNNVAAAKKTIVGLSQVLPSVGIGPAAKALEGSIMIARDRITQETRERLQWLVGKYV
jgi:5'-methylthioadenosine phosphorylase